MLESVSQKKTDGLRHDITVDSDTCLDAVVESHDQLMRRAMDTSRIYKHIVT